MPKFIKTIWANEYYQGSILLTASSFLVNALNYFFNFIAGHVLGPAGYGEIFAFNSYLSLTTLPVAIISTAIIRKVSSTPNQLAYVGGLEHYFWQKVKKWLWLLIVGLLLIPFISRITNLNPIFGLFLIPAIYLSFFGSFYTSSLQGMRLFGVMALIGIISALFKLMGGILAIVITSGRLVPIALFLFFSVGVTFVSSFYIFRTHLPHKTVTQPLIDKRLKDIFFRSGFLAMTASIIGMTIYANLDIMYVKKFLTATDAGLYSSWNLFAKIILYLLGPIVSVSFVFFAHQKSDQKKALIISLFVLAAIGISSFLGYVMLGKLVIFVFFGDRFYRLIPYLGMASAFGTFFATITFVNNYFLAKNHWACLILPFTLPFFLFFLILFGKQITSIMLIQIFFSFTVTLIYLGILLFENSFTKMKVRL